ncbi:MAG TPA: hypothetical protein VL400_05625 [Polyangiaceae bacterium]|nr:hypothetical protein [Polyangiaceae bacterium]
MTTELRHPRAVAPGRALLHPLWIASLALLLLNDHVLKGAGIVPAWLTGKLSDFAGLVMAPPLFAAMLRVRTRRGLALATLAVGVVFAALELSGTLTAAAEAVYRAVGLTWKSWSDPTDLLALTMLPVAYALVVRTASPSRAARSAPSRPRAALELALGALGVTASIATTQSMDPQTCDIDTVDCDADGWSVPDDCDDYDPSVYPGVGCLPLNAEDVCADGIDDDADGLVDCADPDCQFACADLAALCSSLATFDLLTTTSLDGSTLTGSSLTDGSCIGADSPEVIFRTVVPTAGTLTLGVPTDHGVHLRGGCTLADTEVACAVPGEGGGTITVPVYTGEELTVVVEAEDPLLAGPFSVPLTFVSEGCGNGVLDQGETCDDANAVAGDGCSQACGTEVDVLCEEATPIPVGTTDLAMTPTTSVTLAPCAPAIASARSTLSFTPTSTGTLSLLVSSDADVAVTTASTCEAPLPSTACSSDAPAGGIESLALPAAEGQPVFVFVERLSGEATAISVTASVVAQ